MARILVIEDNDTNLELMTYLLKAFGHTVIAAGDGEEGLEAVRREMPDLIICDVHLPKLNGYEVARRLKAHPGLHRIPLVAVTALAMVGDREKVLAGGFDGYIAKPIDPKAFVGQVEAFLGAPERSTLNPAPPVAEAEARPRRAGPVAILVVDDSPVNISLARSVLEPFGYYITAAKTVRDALALAAQTPPDLILSDLHMPGEDGFAFIRAVKADPRLRAIPFVFISSTVLHDQDRTNGLALGADKFILRPIEPQAFLSEIESCLRDTGRLLRGKEGTRDGEDPGR